MKPFDTDKMPWLFTPHGEGELNEYFSSDHSIVISETSKLKSRIMELDAENRELRKQLADMERKMKR